MIVSLCVAARPAAAPERGGASSLAGPQIVWRSGEPDCAGRLAAKRKAETGEADQANVIFSGSSSVSQSLYLYYDTNKIHERLSQDRAPSISRRELGIGAASRLGLRALAPNRRQNARGRPNTIEFSPSCTAVSCDFHVS